LATKEINGHIKSGNFARVYLFFGDESFLVGHWQKRLVEGILGKSDGGLELNFETFEGKGVAVTDIIASCETLPFMAEHRVVLVRGSELFQAGRKDDSEAMAKYIADIPESTVLMFIEDGVDKRGRLYKRVKDAGFVGDAETPKEGELADWAMKLCASRKKVLGRHTAFHLIRNVENNMQLLFNELEKLISYVGEDQEITIEHIDALCTKSLDIKVFDLMKAVGARDVRGAVALYGSLMNLKESPLMVLAMIARQYRFYLQCASLAESGVSQKDIASQLGLHPFAVKEFVAGGRSMSKDAMLGALEGCLETDFSIKTGKMGDAQAVELLIVKLCQGGR